MAEKMLIRPENIVILIIDDQPHSLRFLSNILVKEGYRVQRSISGELTINAGFSSPPDLILLDVVMPRMDGYEVCQRLKENEKTREIPVIFLSILHETDHKVKAFEVGGVDYITKPFQVEEVLARVKNQLIIQQLSKQLKEQNSQLQREVEVRKQTEQALRESQGRLQKLATNIPGVIYQFVRDCEGKLNFEYISYNCLTIYELEVEKILENPELCFNQNHPDDGEALEKAVTMSAETLEPFAYEWRIVTPSGKLKWLQSNSRPEMRDNGDVVWYGVLFDISDRKQSDLEMGKAQTALERQIQRELLIGKITQQIRSSLQPDQIFQTAVTQIGQTFGVNRCLIHTYTTNPLVDLPLAAEYVEPNCESIRNTSIPIWGNPHVVQMMIQDRAIASNNVYLEPLLQAVLPICREVNLKSMLAIRTSYQGEANGAICLHQCDRYREWTEDEIDLLEAVADQVGIAIAQARLLEREKQRLQQLDRQNHHLQAEVRTRVRAEQALQESEAELRAIFLAMTDLVLVRNAEGRCIKIAPTSLSNLVKPFSEMMNKTLHEVLPKSIADLVLNAIQQVLKTQKSSNVEYSFSSGEREIWLDAKISPLSADSVIIVARDITDRKLSEDKLIESQQRISFLLQQTPIAIIELNLNLEVITWNPATENLFGYTQQEVIGHNVPDFIVPNNCYNQIFKFLSNQVNADSFACYTTNEIITKDGRTIVCEWYNTPLTNENGRAIGIALMAVDITERQQAETELQESALRQRAIARIIEKMRQTLDIREIFHATTRELGQTMKCDRVAIYRFNPDWSGEFVAESVDGNWISLIQEQQNDLNFTEGTVENENCLVQKFDSTSEEVCDTYLQETEGGAYTRGTTYLCVQDIYKQGFDDCYIQLLERFEVKSYITVPIFCGENLWGLLASYQNSAPRQWSEAEINVAVHIGKQLGVAVQQAELLARTQRQSLELMKSKEAAEVANRAKSQFLASMSHELRTPLNAILGFSQVMARNISITPEQKEYIEIINRSGEHLLELINDVLSMSKIEAGQIAVNKNRFNLYKLLDRLKEMLQLKAKLKGLSLIFEQPQNLPEYIQTDESKLRQVLINLIGNAIKFTTHGSVNLRVRSQPGNDIIGENKCQLFFEVADTGPGISPCEIPTLFQPFVQTDTGRKSMQGTGLGLPISQQFIKIMGGDISVESKLGQGTNFTFNIQVDLATKSDEQEKYSNKQVIGLEADQQNYRILIVEDIIENRQLLIEILKPLGFETLEACNGEEGIAMHAIWKPHLILMDMLMPIMDGYKATRHIKQTPEGEGTIIIALTASAFEEQRQVIFSAGCDDFICKPFREEVLFEKIATHLKVRYIYEEEKLSTSVPDLTPPKILTAEDLSVMPTDWLVNLYQAAICVDDSGILELIKQIPESEAALANALTDLVENFRIDIIIDLTQLYYDERPSTASDS
ncbi:response regulator [Tychonema sp. BBK16]|uniref:response regulator n=1 Tax=Tychonema sp. BBK16 TaxID=2699888 RepID=UPI001F3B0759|nr:response regulator [Tychonema sp. BBK16]MCF6375699.1 response regulator [Tychonema sp. BBK16]